jgi:hypothetical protein
MPLIITYRVSWPLPAGKEVEDTLRIVNAQTQEAAAKKQVVEGEEAIASEKAAAAKAIKVKKRLQPVATKGGWMDAYSIGITCIRRRQPLRSTACSAWQAEQVAIASE